MNFALIMFITIIFLQHFWENNIKRYCHSTDLKNKGGSLCLYGGLHVINLNAHVYFQSFAWHLQLRSPPPPRLFPLKQRQSPACFSHEISMDSADPLPWETILSHWLCRQTMIKEKHNTDVTTADYFNFLWECLAKVLTNQNTPFTKAWFQNKNNRVTSRLAMGLSSHKEWSLQLWTQFMQLRKQPEKNSGL